MRYNAMMDCMIEDCAGGCGAPRKISETTVGLTWYCRACNEKWLRAECARELREYYDRPILTPEQEQAAGAYVTELLRGEK